MASTTSEEYLDFMSHNENQLVLSVSVDVQSKTTTCITSTQGDGFLQYCKDKIKFDFLKNLQKFLTDEYKIKQLKLERKKLTLKNDTPRTPSPKKKSAARSIISETEERKKVKRKQTDKQDKQTCKQDKQTDKQDKQTGIQQSIHSRSGRKIKRPKWMDETDITNEPNGSTEPLASDQGEGLSDFSDVDDDNDDDFVPSRDDGGNGNDLLVSRRNNDNIKKSKFDIGVKSRKLFEKRKTVPVEENNLEGQKTEVFNTKKDEQSKIVDEVNAKSTCVNESENIKEACKDSPEIIIEKPLVVSEKNNELNPPVEEAINDKEIPPDLHVLESLPVVAECHEENSNSANAQSIESEGVKEDNHENLECYDIKIKQESEIEQRSENDTDKNPVTDTDNLTCPVCKLTFKSQYRLRMHMEIHGEPKYPCDLCGKKFRTARYVYRHKKETHKCMNPNTDTEFQNSKFVEPYGKMSASENSEHNSEHVSNGIDETLDDASDLQETGETVKDRSIIKADQIEKKINNLEDKEIVNDENNLLTCKICNQSFMKEFSLTRHMLRRHEVDAIKKFVITEGKDDPASDLETVFKCRECDQVFYKSEERIKHELHTHDLAIVKKYEGSANRGKLICPICKTKRQSIESMKIHIRHHFEMDAKDITCPICNKTFKTKSRLLIHKPIHNNPHIPCHVCGKKFRTMKYVKRHLTETHRVNLTKGNCQTFEKIEKRKEKKPSEKNPGMCDICGKVFKSQSIALIHRNTHTGDQKFICNICDRTFFTKRQLINHQQIHKDTKDFVCEICGKAFRIAQGLRMHKMRHHDKVTYKCDVCDRTFKCQGGKKYHMLKEHNDIVHMKHNYKLWPCKYCDHVSSSYQYYLRHESTHIDNKTKICNICDRRFPTQSQLTQHRKSHFTQEKRYGCKICKFKTVTPYKLKRHLHSSKHIENCYSMGINADLARNEKNRTIVEEIVPEKRSQLEDDLNSDRDATVGRNMQGHSEPHFVTIKTEDQTESNVPEQKVEVKYVEITDSLDPAQIIYTASEEIFIAGRDGELTSSFIYDPSINQAVESILRLQRS